MAKKSVRFGPGRSQTGTRGQSILKKSPGVYTARRASFPLPGPAADDRDLVVPPPRTKRSYDFESELEENIQAKKAALRLRTALTLDPTLSSVSYKDRSIVDVLQQKLDAVLLEPVVIQRPRSRIYRRRHTAPLPISVSLPQKIKSRREEVLGEYPSLMLASPRTLNFNVSRRIQEAFAELENDLDLEPRRIGGRKIPPAPRRLARDVEFVPRPRPVTVAIKPVVKSTERPLSSKILERAELYSVPDWEKYSNTCGNLRKQLFGVVANNNKQREILGRYIPLDLQAPLDSVSYEVDVKYDELAERMPSLYRTNFARSAYRDATEKIIARPQRSASVPPNYGSPSISETRAKIRDVISKNRNDPRWFNY